MGRTFQIICGAVLTLAVVAFGAWSLIAFEPPVPSRANQPTSQPHSGYEAGGAECRAESLQRMPADERQAKETECAKARDDQRREQADLDQQTRSANAGSILVHLTKHQTRIALLQAVLSLLAVVATGLAAWAAVVAANAARSSVEDARRDAAEQAERFGYQLKAAQDAAQAAARGARATSSLATQAAKQVRVSELAAERQMRAYVSIRTIEITDFAEGKHPVVRIKMRNTGATPAKRVCSRVEIVRAQYPEHAKGNFIEPSSNSALEIGGKVDTVQTVAGDENKLSAGQIADFLAGKWGYAVFGFITYRDVFGKFRRVTFRGYADLHSFRAGKPLQVFVAPKGTRST